MTAGARSRFILRYTGGAAKPAEHVARIRATPNTTVLGESDKMLFVEGSEAKLKTVLQSCPGWVLSAETTIPVPDPRPSIREGQGT